jgi:succinoglycan biosynthesis transport protein ExoP
MADIGADDAPAIERYLHLIRRRWPVILVVTVMVTVVALTVSLERRTVYEASADVYLTRLDIAGQLSGVSRFDFNQPAQRLLETQAQLARVPSVATRAVLQANLQGTSAGSLLKGSSVSARPNADLLTFAVRDRKPDVAIKLANAYAAAFVAYRRDLDVADIQRVIDDVEHQLVGLNAQTQGPLVTVLTADLQKLLTVRALQSSNVTVVRSAGAAGAVGNRPISAGVAGGAVGLALGAGFALLLEALDRRARSEAEIGRRLGVPLLGRLPSPKARRRRSPGLVMFDETESTEAEAFRVARTNIVHAVATHDRSIMLSAVEQEVGETPRIAASIAVALARNATNTILIDLDLRRGAVDELFGTQDRPGLTEVVTNQLDLDSALVTVWKGETQSRRRGVHHADADAAGGAVLQLLPIGSQLASVGEFVASPKLHEVVERLRDKAQLVVIHGPPLLGTADALALTAVVDGLIVVAGIGLVRRDVLSDLGDELADVVETLGVIVTGVGHALDGPMPRGGRRSRPRGMPSMRRGSGNGGAERSVVQADAMRDVADRESHTLADAWRGIAPHLGSTRRWTRR